jgi:hypothetical protein
MTVHFADLFSEIFQRHWYLALSESMKICSRFDFDIFLRLPIEFDEKAEKVLIFSSISNGNLL